MKKVKRLWEKMSSGVLIPAGSITETSDRTTISFLQVKDKAIELEKFLQTNGINLSSTSYLSQLIVNSKKLWERWFMNRMDQLDMKMLFMALHLDRIAEAVLPLKGTSGYQRHLKIICNGNLDFFKRDQSLTKDIFWEVEMWSILRRKLQNVRLCEPPDIVVELKNAKVGIACKKIYSERHVEKVLSQAVSQIEKELDVGIAAMNIDDLIPADKVLRINSIEEMGKVVQRLNEEFIQRHERHFRKYLASGRLISVIISTTLITDIVGERVGMNNSRQFAIWTIPGLAPRKKAVVDSFYDFVMSTRSPRRSD